MQFMSFDIYPLAPNFNVDKGFQPLAPFLDLSPPIIDLRRLNIEVRGVKGGYMSLLADSISHGVDGV